MELLNALVHTLYSVANWVPYLLGSGALMWIVLVVAAMFFAPAAALLGALSPLLKGACELVVWWFKALINGAVDMFDNLASILFVTTMMFIAGWFVYNHTCPLVSARAPMIVGTVKPNTAKPTFVQKYFPKLKVSAKPAPTPAPKPVVKSDSTSLVKPFWEE